jgi:hypothetical protein
MHLPISITNHTGLIKNTNGIDYNYNNIPPIITILNKYYNIEETDAIESILLSTNTTFKSTINNTINCLANEITTNLNNSYKLNLKFIYFQTFEITNQKGIPPFKLSSNYSPYYVIFNIGRNGPITFKNNITNQKFTFTIDNGSLLLIHDNEYKFTTSIVPFLQSNIVDDTENNQKRNVIILYFK